MHLGCAGHGAVPPLAAALAYSGGEGAAAASAQAACVLRDQGGSA